MRVLAYTTALAAIAGVLVGCPAKEAATPAAAPSTRPASGPAGAAAASRPASGPAAGGPASAPAEAPAVANDKPFSGLVKLADGVAADSVKPTDVLFVMARKAIDGKPGPLVAVQRHQGVTLPMRYEMSAANLMMPGMPFSGPFMVSARIDRDGDPMTKGADDLYGELAAPIEGGAEGAHLVLAPPPAAP
jgi:hypothetical protein